MTLRERMKGRTLGELAVVFDFLSGERFAREGDEPDESIQAFRSLLLEVEDEATVRTSEPTCRVVVTCHCGAEHRGWLVGCLLPTCPQCERSSWKAWRRVVTRG
jgi:hypothetical protein